MIITIRPRPSLLAASTTAAHTNNASSRNDGAGGGRRIVVLTKMFTLFELEDDPTLLLDLKDDVRENATPKSAA